MEETLSAEVELTEIALNSPAFWQGKLGVPDAFHSMICLVNGWNRATFMTQAAYEAAVQAMSFTVH